MFYTTAWCITHEGDFRKAVPLEMLGASMRLHGSTAAFTIVILEGMEKLSPEYVRMLGTLGFTLKDYGEQFRSIVSAYPAIDRFYSHYERNCLLRWIALKRLSVQAGDPASFSPCWHLDSDVLLHTSLNELAADTAGKTFMLQGCPVLVSIADPRWFDRYEENLLALNADITGYSARAFAEKNECLSRDSELANQSLYRNPIGSDQDLLEYLVSSGRILQAPATTIFDSRYYFVQNPLSMNHWHAAQMVSGTGETVIGAGKIPAGINSRFSINERSEIFMGRKQLPFTHFQGIFSRYAGVYMTLRQLHLPGALARRILRYTIYDEKFNISVLFKIIAKINDRRPLSKSREAVIREMMQPANPPRLISLLNLLLEDA